MITWIYQIGYKVIFVLLLCVSCKKSVQKGIESIDIGLDQIEVPSTNLFDQMEIHPLGGDAYPVIFEITRGRSNGRQYLFADGNYDGNLILCDKNGENLSRINQKGSQPTSYLELWDFELDTAGHIGVYDFQRQVLLTYHVNGDFINKFSIGYNFLRFTWFENNLILFTAKHANYVNNKSINFDLLWISPEGEITQSLIPFDENKLKVLGCIRRIHF
ncbi:MAG: 6-bladed beta-propeller [Cyclobacteriaceae bacterium]|nr:6-bladed beta-propeller [Cyclobacteriaceae bacterium]